MSSMSSKLITAIALFAALHFAHGAEENPFAKAKVGDWAEFSIKSGSWKSGATPGKLADCYAWEQIGKKTDTEVIVNGEYRTGKAPEDFSGRIGSVGKSLAKHANTTPETVSLSEKFTAGLPRYMLGERAKAQKSVEIVKSTSGSETIIVSGKKLETQWVELEWKGEGYTGKTKTWFSKTIPVEGVVKQTTEYEQSANSMKGTSIIELKSFGFGS